MTMDSPPSPPPPAADANGHGGNGIHQNADGATRDKTRSRSMSQRSEDSQTAADFIRDQMQLEADARKALPYSIEHCTKPLGPLRQSVFACLTCNPPPADPAAPYDSAAGVCYACSVSCHGEHALVEIFTKRNFTCDCGTARFPAESPCALRLNPATRTKGGVHAEEPDANNKYNQNFRNRFCGCSCDYDPFQQKGTMFQCLGLGTAETGGCGEDWWHPGCVVGLGPDWHGKTEKTERADAAHDSALPTIAEDAELPETSAPEQNGHAREQEDGEDEEMPPPPGFPVDDDFDGFLCYKCVDAFPWIKRYAGTPGFLPPVYHRPEGANEPEGDEPMPAVEDASSSKKRKASGDVEETDGQPEPQEPKRQRSEAAEDTTEPASSHVPQNHPQTSAPVDSAANPTAEDNDATKTASAAVCKLSALPPAPPGRFSLFFTEDFRAGICRCASCFPLLAPHAQLLEEEETYEPPVSEAGGGEGGSAGNNDGASTHGSGSLLERGESALRNVDRVRAIEGVMAYNHLKDKLKPFFARFAESGQAVSAEDIKEYFAKLRGDDLAIREAAEAAGGGKGGDGEDNNKREQSGY